jgi:hypothetical protein
MNMKYLLDGTALYFAIRVGQSYKVQRLLERQSAFNSSVQPRQVL